MSDRRDIYRDFEVFRTDQLPPIPTWRQFAWSYVHVNYDGAPDSGDERHGFAASESECRAEIDTWHEENSQQ